MPGPKRPTYKERKFVEAYIANEGNGTKAALIATNVSKKNADKLSSQMLARPRVQNYLEERIAELAADYPNANKDFVALLKNVAESALATPDLKAKVDALEKLSKIYGHTAPKETHTKTLKASIKLPSND